MPPTLTCAGNSFSPQCSSSWCNSHSDKNPFVRYLHGNKVGGGGSHVSWSESRRLQHRFALSRTPWEDSKWSDFIRYTVCPIQPLPNKKISLSLNYLIGEGENNSPFWSPYKPSPFAKKFFLFFIFFRVWLRHFKVRYYIESVIHLAACIVQPQKPKASQRLTSEKRKNLAWA